MVAMEDAIQRALLARARIVGTERRGRIEISYSSLEELERLAAIFGVQS
jgi:hypothetical protein